MRAKPDRRQEVFEILSGFVAPTREEPGCLDYHFHSSDDDPDEFMFYENWRTFEDLEEHLMMPYLAVLRERGDELLAGKVEIRRYTMNSHYGATD